MDSDVDIGMCVGDFVDQLVENVAIDMAIHAMSHDLGDVLKPQVSRATRIGFLNEWAHAQSSFSRRD